MIRRIEMIRGIITQTASSVLRLMRFSATGRTGEIIEDREVLQQYGMSSRPPDGAECMILKEGNHFIMIASDDRRYRIALEKGEVAIYTDEVGIFGRQIIHLKKGNKIEINSNVEVKVMAPTVKVGNNLLIDTAIGIVTQQCVCSITGAVHPQGSLSAKATL